MIFLGRLLVSRASPLSPALGCVCFCVCSRCGVGGVLTRCVHAATRGKKNNRKQVFETVCGCSAFEFSTSVVRSLEMSLVDFDSF